MKRPLIAWSKTRKSARRRKGDKPLKRSVLAGSIARFCRVLAVSTVAALGFGEAKAAILFWDPNSPVGMPGTNLGGSHRVDGAGLATCARQGVYLLTRL